ncbi:MAG: tRNA pseudouridine(13) synthase TruD [Candidatus Woesearchaeota archaeon]
MILKKHPEDFIVKEVFKRTLNKTGRYSIYLLKKIDYTTEAAITEVAKQLNVDRKKISYAGLKDRRAITYQYISILDSKPSGFETENITLTYQGKSDGPVSLGDLEGNNFEIVVRELKDPKIAKKRVPNYFDEQRFSSNNHVIGRFIVNSKFEEAVNLILEFDQQKARHLKKVLYDNPNDYVNALRQIQPKMLMLYVHAYQSFLWNETVKRYLQKNPRSNQRQIPIIGFGSDIPEDLEPIIDELLEEENISLRSFIIREIPSLSAEGTNRSLFIDYKDLEFEVESDGDIYKKVRFKFYLPKGSYATMLVKNLLDGSSGI